MFGKKALSLILSLILVFSAVLVPASALDGEEKVVFADLNELRTTVIKIFNDNYDELVSIARSLEDMSEEDAYITYDENCGPCSTAFQKILDDNGILTETQRPTSNIFHVYNLLRTSFSSTPDEMSEIIIDTTYKQFIIDNYTNAGYGYAEMAEDLPAVLVYEYGNEEQLKEQLSGLKTRFGEERFDATISSFKGTQFTYIYKPQELQSLAYKPQMKYSSKFVDRLMNESGEYEPKLADKLILNSTTGQWQKEFTYDGNGVYRCYVTSAEVSSFAGGFNIVNEENKVLYGASVEYDRLKYMSTISYSPSPEDVRLMKKGSEYPLSLQSMGLFLPLLITIDLRAGEDTPAIYAYTINRTLNYGDVNADGVISIRDVTELQQANAEIKTLDMFGIDVANVLKGNPLDIRNATEIQKYIAKYDTAICGDTVYFTAVLKIGSNDSMGFVDVKYTA